MRHRARSASTAIGLDHSGKTTADQPSSGTTQRAFATRRNAVAPAPRYSERTARIPARRTEPKTLPAPPRLVSPGMTGEQNDEPPAYDLALPRKRVAAGVLYLDTEGRLLLVDPVYKTDWEIPGGAVEKNESPRAGAMREIARRPDRRTDQRRPDRLSATPDIGEPLIGLRRGPSSHRRRSGPRTPGRSGRGSRT